MGHTYIHTPSRSVEEERKGRVDVKQQEGRVGNNHQQHIHIGMEFKLLQIVAILASFQGTPAASRAVKLGKFERLGKIPIDTISNIDEGKNRILKMFSYVGSSMETGMQKIAADFGEKLETTTQQLVENFEKHKQLFAKSVLAEKMDRLSERMTAKKEQMHTDVQAALTKLNGEMKRCMKQTRENIWRLERGLREKMENTFENIRNSLPEKRNFW